MQPPLTGSSEPRVPLLPGMDAGGDCQWRRNLPLVCPAVCACAEVRPPLCLVRAMPLHVRECVCVCVCRCALTCLSFLCMCRSGVWSSCCPCVLVPLFSSEQHLVSLVPFPGGLSLPQSPSCHSGTVFSRLLCPPQLQHSSPSPSQTVEPKLAQLSMTKEAFGPKYEGGGWDGQGRNPGRSLGC